MYYILGILGIFLLNFSMNKLGSSAEKNMSRKCKRLKLLEDKRYISILDNFKESLDINLKTYLLFNPKALQRNCREVTLENEIYIIVEKEINEERIKGSIAHELGHIKMHHEEKGKHYKQIGMFIFNLFLLTFFLYPFFNFKIYIEVCAIGLSIYWFYIYVVYRYIMRRHELEADNVAVKLMGKEYFKTLATNKGLNGKIPSFLSDHPSTKARLRNARKTYEAYNKKTINQI